MTESRNSARSIEFVQFATIPNRDFFLKNQKLISEESKQVAEAQVRPSMTESQWILENESKQTNSSHIRDKNLSNILPRTIY
jgi:hypothetical protein